MFSNLCPALWRCSRTASSCDVQSFPLKIWRRPSTNYGLFLEVDNWQRNMVRKEDVAPSRGSYQTAKGRIYGKTPFRYSLDEGKRYSWCSCGYSHSQPFCDGMHKKPWIQSPLKPVKFIAKETREVWFCNCKQTNTKPYCDKSCDSPEVQAARV